MDLWIAWVENDEAAFFLVIVKGTLNETKKTLEKSTSDLSQMKQLAEEMLQRHDEALALAKHENEKLVAEIEHCRNEYEDKIRSLENDTSMCHAIYLSYNL